MKTEIVIHRVNTLEHLQRLKSEYGAEVDVRTRGSGLILNHEPYGAGDSLVDFLDEYRHGLLILNVKEAGIEEDVLQAARTRGIQHTFLLDVEFPYIYQATRRGERAIAMRYSEDESMETVLNYRGRADWVWIDTNTHLPLNAGIIQDLRGFRTCLVCPERWGRPGDIASYRDSLTSLRFTPDAVMTSERYAKDWERLSNL